MAIQRTCGSCGHRVPIGFGSRCPDCVEKDNQRRHAKSKAYGTTTGYWRKLRARVLERDGHRCQLQHHGCTQVARTVHIDPELGGDHRLATMDRCLSACLHCHGVEDAPRAQQQRY